MLELLLLLLLLLLLDSSLKMSAMRARTSGGVGPRMMAALSGGLAEGIGCALPRKLCRGPLLRKLCFGYSVWVHGTDFVEVLYYRTFISSKSALRRSPLCVEILCLCCSWRRFRQGSLLWKLRQNREQLDQQIYDYLLRLRVRRKSATV